MVTYPLLSALLSCLYCLIRRGLGLISMKFSPFPLAPFLFEVRHIAESDTICCNSANLPLICDLFHLTPSPFPLPPSPAHLPLICDLFHLTPYIRTCSIVIDAVKKYCPLPLPLLVCDLFHLTPSIRTCSTVIDAVKKYCPQALVIAQWGVFVFVSTKNAFRWVG